MVWKELLTPFIGGRQAEVAELAQKVDAGFTGLLDAITDYESADKDRMPLLKKVRRRIEQFPRDQMLSLERAVPGRRKALVASLASSTTQTLQALDDEAASLLERESSENLRERPAVVQRQRELQEIAASNRGYFNRLGFLGTGLYAGSMVGVFLLGAFVRFHYAGLGPATQEILWPPAAYEAGSKPAAFQLTSGFQSDFLSTFSRFYFERSKLFPPPIAKDQKGTLKASVQAKVMTSNQSSREFEFISSLVVAVTFQEERDFPWHLLDVTPDIEIEASEDGISLRDEGVGPSANLRWTATTRSGLEIFRGNLDLLHRRLLRLSLQEPRAPVETRLVGTEGHIQPLFRRLEPSPGTEAEGSFFEHDGVRYQEIQTIDDLRKVTKTSFGEPLSLSIDYESLRGEKSHESFTMTLPKDRIYFLRGEDLLDRDPREPEFVTSPYAEPSPTRSSPGMRALEAIAPQLFEGPKPKGVDVLVQRASLDLAELETGKTARVVLTPDVFLNPRGVLSLYVDLDHPRTGIYQVAVEVNGKPCSTFSVESLIPEAFQFDDSQRDRFRPKKAEITPGSEPPAPRESR